MHMRYYRVTFVASLALLALLAACSSSDGPTPPPPPPVNRVASLTRADTSILQFTGRKVAIRKLFAARDASGATVADARLTCVTPAGFTLTGDSLVAPTAEARGKLRCSATTISPSIAASSAQRVASLPADPQDSLTVTAGIDLRAHVWRVSYRCKNGGWQTNDGTPIDSAGVLAAPVDSVVYPLEQGYVSQWGGVAQMYFKGRLVRWLHPGTTDTITVGPWNGPIVAQLPDSLALPINALGGPDFVRVPVAVNGGLRTYTGGSFCTDGFPANALTIEEVLP
jgi:hypothetical protein